jgi:hypothetical protein
VKRKNDFEYGLRGECVSNLYVTTSRKPSVQTRKLARWLERLLGAACENRGKRSVEEVVARAAERGLSRVLFVHEARGNPSELVFRDEARGWLEPSIAISGVVMPERSKRVRVPKEVKAKPLDAAGEKIAALFGLEDAIEEEEKEEEKEGEALALVASAREIFFEAPDGERVGPVIKIARLANQRV